MNTTAAACVARGAEWLDGNAPGWERKIDLATLDLTSCSDCVIGQTFGNFLQLYTITTDEKKINFHLGNFNTVTSFARMHGFEAPPTAEGQDYDGLRDAWTELLKERFSSGILSDN